jgi:predicted ATPase
LSLVGEALMQAGRLDDAQKMFDEGLAVAEQNHELCQRAELYRLKGECALLAGHSANGRAEGLFGEAIATAKRQRSRAWELRSTASLARLYLQTGRRQEGRERLSGIYNQFPEGFDRSDARAPRRAWRVNAEPGLNRKAPCSIRSCISSPASSRRSGAP